MLEKVHGEDSVEAYDYDISEAFARSSEYKIDFSHVYYI